MGHGNVLYDDEISVPLIIRFPGGERGGTRIQNPVSLTGVMPMILERFSVATARGTAGRELVESGEPGPMISQGAALKELALISWPYKYIDNFEGDAELYHLEHPGERSDVGARHPGIADNLTWCGGGDVIGRRIRREASSAARRSSVSDRSDI